MMEMRIMEAATWDQIAARFNVSDKTVKNTLSWAERAGLIADLEDELLKDVASLAKQAVKEGLQDKEHKIEAAKLGLDVIKLLTPKPAKTGVSVSNPGQESDDLAAHINQLRSTVPAGAIEGAVIPSLPAAATEAPARRDAESAGNFASGDTLLAQRASTVGETSGESGDEGTE